MAATGYTPISLYYSATAAAAPTAANLVPGELALNNNDGKLYYEDSAGAVQVIASKATGSVPGSTTQVVYNNAGALAGSANLTFNGTTLTANTIGAFTLSGTVAGGGNQINNVIIGTTTPLAGFFTTASATTSVTTPSVTNAGTLALSATGANVVTASTNSTERLRITSNGGVSFGATGTAYGTSGQVLQSNGDAPPTWATSTGITTGKSIAMAMIFGF